MAIDNPARENIASSLRMSPITATRSSGTPAAAAMAVTPTPLFAAAQVTSRK